MPTTKGHMVKTTKEQRLALNRAEWERRAIAALSEYGATGRYEWIMATQGTHRRRVEYRNGQLVLTKLEQLAE